MFCSGRRMLEGIILAGGVEQSVTFYDPALSKHFANRGYVIRVRIFVRLLRRTDASDPLHVFSGCYEKKLRSSVNRYRTFVPVSCLNITNKERVRVCKMSRGALWATFSSFTVYF